MATKPKTSASPASDSEQESHDGWLREEVEKTVDRLKDGSSTPTGEKEHDLRWQEKRAALLAAAKKHE